MAFAVEVTPTAFGQQLDAVLPVTPQQFGAVGDGTADDTAAVIACCNYAFANGFTVDGQGKTFAVTGGLRFDNLVSAHLRNIELKQLAPNGTVGGVPTIDRRTLFFNTCNKVRLQSVRVNRGTDKTSGSLSSAAGIYIEGGNGHFLLDVRVHGDGQGSGIVLDGCSDSFAENVIGHDMAFDSVSATDDLIMGVWVNACTDSTFIGLKGFNLTGNATGFPANRFTRGIAVSGCVNCSFIAPKAYNVDQGMDVTGEPASNKNLQISAFDYHDCASWGLKIANTGFTIAISGGNATDCGLSGVVFSGPSGAGDAAKGEHITISGVIIRNTGSNGASWGSHIGLRIMAGGGPDTNFPRGIYPSNCLAIDDQATPTMTVGFSNEIPYDGSRRLNMLNGCRSVGHTVSAQSGFHATYAKANGTGTQSIANSTDTSLDWDTEAEDSMGMHSTVSATNLIAIPLTGLWRVRGALAFASNATGFRRATIYKNSVAQTPYRAANAVNGDITTVFVDEAMQLTAGDGVALAAFQNSGGALNVDRTNSWLSVDLIRET